MFGYIYETINLINGKKYIGKHKSKEFDKNYYGSGTYLKKALEKYGKENFSIKIIEEISNDKDYKYLSERECSWIEATNAVKSDKYYNNSYGGENEGWSGVNKAIKNTGNYPSRFSGKHHSIKSKEKISDKLKGRPSPMKGKYLHEETKHKISKSCKEAMTSEVRAKISNSLKGKSPWNKGKKMSEETKRKISESCKEVLNRPDIKEKLSKKASIGFKQYYKNKENVSPSKGTVWINNGIINKRINSKDLSIFLNEGYTIGMKR